MSRRALLLGLALLSGLLLAASASAQYRTTNPTNNEESICRTDSNVFICDNFEDMATGTIPTYSGGYKTPGWFNSPNGSQLIVSGAQCFGGTGRCLRIRTPNGVASGGTIEQAWDAAHKPAPNGYREIYWRMYQRFDSNYVFSQIGTKGWEWFTFANGGETGAFNSTQQTGVTTPGITIITNAGLNPPFDGVWHLLQNANGTLSWALNQWYCLEMHLKYNTGASTPDAVVEAWIQRIGVDASPVQHWNYQNFVADARANNQTFGMFLVSYINCNSSNDPNGQLCVEQNGDRDKYIDNVIVSTARIGCGGTIPTQPPAAPTNFKVTTSLKIPLGVRLTGTDLVRVAR
jgi:hypothetical protein